jgi:cytochrome c oxidase subunit IV
MNNPKTSSAEHVDIQRRLLFLAMLLLSLIFAIKTGFYLVDDEMKGYLSLAGKIIFALGAIVVVVAVYWKLRFIPRNERYLLNSTDSFVNQMMNQACKISWIMTLVLLVFITNITSKDGSALPAGFYVDLTLFFMLAVFSVSFFILFRAGDRGEHQKAGL